MAAALLLVVALASVDGDSDVPLGAYIAGPLGVVGIGLIIGTWVGRTKALIAAGVLLAVALPPVSAADRWSGGVVDLTAQPASVAGIQRSYDYGVADMLLDFRNVRFEDGKRVITSIDVGVGDVRIVVPPEVDVTFRGDVGLGDIALGGLSASAALLPPEALPAAPPEQRSPPPDRNAGNGDRDQPERGSDRSPAEGVSITQAYTDYGIDGPGGGELVLDVDLGVGQVEVSRA
jgi:hypothetical protein